MTLPRVSLRLLAVFALCLLVCGCKSKATKANFDSVKDGMSLAEVEKLLGKGNKDTGDGSNVAGQFGVAVMPGATVGGGDVYTWENDKQTFRITFKQDKVVHKEVK